MLVINSSGQKGQVQYKSMLNNASPGQKIKCSVNICLSLIPIQHECQATIFIRASHQAGFLWLVFRGKPAAQESRYVHCWSMLVIESCELCKPLQSLPAYVPGDLADHRFTRPERPVQYESMLVLVGPTGTNARWSW